MTFSLKTMMVATVMMISSQVYGQAKEAPPMEPPYTNESEFDPILSEDPSANSAIPTSQEPQTQSQQTNKPATSEPQVQPRESRIKSSETMTSATSTSTDYSKPKTPSNLKRKSAQEGVRLIHHPDAKKGLVRIEQDGTYVYKLKVKPTDKTGSVRFGYMTPPDISAANNVTNFKKMYGSGDLFTLMVDYEWHPFQKYGKLGIQAGLDLAYAQGNGRFLTPDSNGSYDALEKYTFVGVPMNLGVIYRLEYAKRQWFAPYVSGGLSYIGVMEYRDDNKTSFSGTPAGYGAVGGMFNISAVDKNMAFNMSSEYGIGGLWLVAEYRYLKAFSEDLDFSGGIMSLGVSADF